MTIFSESPLSESGVLIKAVINTCSQLHVNQAKLSEILGVSPATVSRMFDGKETKAMSGKTAEIAKLFIRVYIALGSLFDDPDNEREWFTSENRGLGGIPANLVTSAEGLVNVLGYLETYAGHR